MPRPMNGRMPTSSSAVIPTQRPIESRRTPYASPAMYSRAMLAAAMTYAVSTFVRK